MKYRGKSTSALGPATTMAEQIVHVPFSSQDRDKLEMDRLEIEHKLTLVEIPYKDTDCFHVEKGNAIEPSTNATGLHLLPGFNKALDAEESSTVLNEGGHATSVETINGVSSRTQRAMSAGAPSRRRPSDTRNNSTLDGSVGLEEIF
ncbi:hypothetical protein PsorP6_016319 [Peronosclerospora sorghi]|uniref:Uncharacterized protein n=1 Tax=Peronosclerospora sorghi TaxID=230839 RepID=A0ACC0VMY2_9STRA|nr:hypothetical protein PsorP6_016319 [Peronosclerospora sorghi]